jgi:hypothetical protein
MNFAPRFNASRAPTCAPTMLQTVRTADAAVPTPAEG